MTKFNILLCFLFLLLIVFSACSKKSGIDQLTGRWKAMDISDTSLKNSHMEISFEFTKDMITYEGKESGGQIKKLDVPYTVKSITGDTMNLEGTHPQSQEKGVFYIIINEDKLTMRDPTNTTYVLQRQ